MGTPTIVKGRPHNRTTGQPWKPKPIILFAVVILSLTGALLSQPSGVTAQRSLHHWKRDLEHRLDIYHRHRRAIDDIISSSIYPARDDVVSKGPIRVLSRSNVRFSDLIIPAGALQLSDPAMAQAAVRILADKTRNYVATKEHELREIQLQLESMRRQLDEPANRFIYKGQRNSSGPPADANGRNQIIMGTRVFKQAQYVRLISGRSVTMARVNGTSVNQVLDDTYLRNRKFAVRDFNGRPYFEGRKTLYDSVFVSQLVSGCCGRLQPMDTARVMLRSKDQDVVAPVLIKASPSGAGGSTSQAATVIQQLSTEQFYNQIITVDPKLPANSMRLARGNVGLSLNSPPENLIRLSNLIHTRQIDRAQLLKTLVFKSPIFIEQALLSQSYPESRLIIGLASQPGFRFDLSHDNYLLRYADHQRHRNGTVAQMPMPVQRVSGAFVIDGMASFVAGLEAPTVNGIESFGQFINEALVRIDRPSNIRGPIEFNALPALLNSPRQPPAAPNTQPAMESPRGYGSNVLIMNVRGHLEVGSINGMRVPQDLIILPNALAPAGQNERLALKPGQPVHVYGPRHFVNRLQFRDSLQVANTVSGLTMPGGVIPLHLNDFIHSVGGSNLWFMDGIEVYHLTTHSNQFDEINLSEVNGGAPSIMLGLMSVKQPDGSVLIKAPLRVANLSLLHTGPNTGLLNGFRPQEVLELNPRYPYETIYGRRTFNAPVEAGDCIFGDINGLANWSNQLIRIDRPNTVQTVYTKLAFTGHTLAFNNSAQPQGVNIDRLNVEFYPDSSPAHYRHNWNYSPEFYLLQQALMRSQTTSNSTRDRYRVNRVRLVDKSGGRVNGIPLNDVVTLDTPFRFADRFTMVGKVEVRNTLEAGIITSSYPIDAMDLAQFNKYRIPISGHSMAPVKLNNLVLGPDNRASYVNCPSLNQTPLSQFMRSIMSLTKPQDVRSNLVFTSAVNFEGLVTTGSSLNGIKNFGHFANMIRNANYVFDKGLQCQSVVVRS